MNKSRKPFSLEEGKIQASLLLKSLRSDDSATVAQAARRFLRMPEFAHYTPNDFPVVTIRRKHALQAIALEQGFTSWPELKCQLPFIRGGFLTQWFVDYEEAKTYQRLNGGFILPFKKQMFLCSAEYISNLGFDVNDPDWALIGFDWVQPNDQIAWQRLLAKWAAIQDARDD